MIVDRETIKEFVETALDRAVPNFSLTQNFYTELTLDSLGAIALFVEVQRHTRVSISPEEAEHIQTGEQLLSFIQNRIAGIPA